MILVTGHQELSLRQECIRERTEASTYRQSEQPGGPRRPPRSTNRLATHRRHFARPWRPANRPTRRSGLPIWPAVFCMSRIHAPESTSQS